MNITLTTGTLETNNNMDGWVITSATAIVDGAEDLPLKSGDEILINGAVWRGDEFIGNIA